MSEKTTKPILDPCCGSRMFYINRADDRVLFCDSRELETLLKDKSSAGGFRKLEIKPDLLIDFRKMPFKDGTFPLVIFDPPHLKTAGATSWLAQKYGVLPQKDWKEYLRKGFNECWRVLKPEGTLIFKWNEDQIRYSELTEIFPSKPVIKHSKDKTSFTVFFKTP